MMLKNFILIGLGGAAGSMLRYVVSLVVVSTRFPLATLLVNIAGSFVIGLVLAFSAKNESFAASWKLFLATGICGGFTTFSAFSAENLQLLQTGKTGLSLLYMAASIVAGIGAALLGYKLISISNG
jgi:fluoride exporter